MGSFSWLKADKLTKVANVVDDEPFKFLIPKEFGGGFIKDYYQDYGYLGTKEDGSPKYDMYELLAFWNREDLHEENFNDNGNLLEWEGLRYSSSEAPKMKEIDEYTCHNRCLGIDIGCYDEQIDKLKYPLKLVSASYNGTYEDCEGRSYGDPNQGWSPIYRKRNEVSQQEYEYGEVILINGKHNGYSIEQCGETLTVGELIQILRQYKKDEKVFLINDNGYTYGSITEDDIRLGGNDYE